MQKTVTFLKWNPKRDFNTDNLVCRVKFSIIDSALIGTPRECESIHTITITVTDILLGNWRIPGGLDFGITEEMIKVALQSLEDYLAQQLKQAPLPDGELEPITMNTENSPKTCPYKLANIFYPSKTSFTVETEDQSVQPDTLLVHPNIRILIERIAYSDDSATGFRRKPPCCSDPKRQGVPIDSATPDRSVATLVLSSFS